LLARGGWDGGSSEERVRGADGSEKPHFFVGVWVAWRERKKEKKEELIQAFVR